MDASIERDRLRAFIDLIIGSLDDEVDGTRLAARGHLSRYHFDRLVSAAIRESPGAFRRRLLLERAAWELRGNQATITRVALGSGYRSVEGFTRAFGRAFRTTPGRFRAAPSDFRLAAPNGVHFHPPGGITLPETGDPRRRHVDFIDRIVGHDIWFTTRLLDRAAELPAEALDRPVIQGQGLWEYPPGEPTMRSLLNEMVANKENRAATLAGDAAPSNGGESIAEMKIRLETAGAKFTKLVRNIKDKGNWDAGFVDALCDPPETFTYGGALAHVITFSTYRRTMAILAMRELGGEDLGIGDPIEWERSLV